MLLALVGVTGVGKSYYKDLLVDNLDFKKVNTIRTRKKRPGEESGKTGLFMTSEEIDSLESQGKIAYRFNVFGGEYAYLSKEIFSKENMVFEMHYTTIYDWKKIRRDIKTIYILPKDLNTAKDMTKKRNLSPEKEKERLNEIDEHYNTFCSDKNLRDQFDYIFYNNYDNESDKEFLSLVETIINQKD